MDCNTPRRSVTSIRSFGSLTLPGLHFPSKFLLQLRITDLDHCRSSMWAAVGQLASQQIFNQLPNFSGMKIVIRFHRIPANGLRNYIFPEAQARGIGRERTKFINKLANRIGWIFDSQKLRYPVDF